MVEGTSIGAVSDYDGNIDFVVPMGSKITVSHVGIDSLTFPVGNGGIGIVVVEEKEEDGKKFTLAHGFGIASADASGAIAGAFAGGVPGAVTMGLLESLAAYCLL